MNNTNMQVICIHCKKTFELSDALENELKENIQEALELKHKEELEKTRKEALADSSKKIKEEFELQLKRTQDDLQEKDERIKKLIEQMSEITQELRDAKKAKEEAKLEMQKRLAEEEEKIRAEAQKKAEEEQHTKIAEKEKQLQDALKANEDMRRKLEQGSQQAQGEVFELEFESILSQHYPNDKVMEVKKGVKGGDIIQEVWDRNGNYAGKILWELKNTKLWSESWVEKLKTDKRTINADEALLISEVLPNDVKKAGFRDGIWVTEREFVIPMADMMRAKLIQLSVAKKALQGKDTKMEILYAYLSGTEFKHRVEAIVDAFTNMQTEIEKEKRYFANKWARDEKNIRHVIDNTLGMHGDLKGIIGNSLPQIKELEIFELESGD